MSAEDIELNYLDKCKELAVDTYTVSYKTSSKSSQNHNEVVYSTRAQLLQEVSC